MKTPHYSYVIINFSSHYNSLFAQKSTQYDAGITGIMLHVPTIALCPKLSRHNVANPREWRGASQADNCANVKFWLILKGTGKPTKKKT